MKKFFLSVIVLISAVGCLQIDLENDLQVGTETANIEVANNKFGVNFITASYVANLLSDKEVTSIEPMVLNGKDTLLYIANYEDGWVVLSGDKRAVPILGFSDKGTFANEIKNPGAATWFNNVADEIYALK